MKRFFFLLSLLISVSIGQVWAADVVDELTSSSFAATNTTYKDFSDVSATSDAKYAGNSAKSNSGGIQMRSKNSNSGIVSTTSGGTVKSVKITVESGSNTIDVYGSNTAYTAVSSLYDSNTQGTKVGSLSATGTITFTDDYAYVGIRSNNGAIYVTSVEITWTTSEGGSSTPTDLTDQQFAWSAASATVTINANDNTFPTLTNTQQLSVTYQSTDQTVATISSTGAITLLKAGTTTIKAVFAGNNNYNAKTVTYSLTVNAASETPSGDEVSDVLTLTLTGVSGTSYSEWSGKTATSDAVYAGNSAGGNSSIQLRSSNNNSGVITTASGGKAKSVTVEWNSNTASGRTIDIYGHNSAYSSATALYNSTTQGAKLGSIVCGTSTSLTITQDCEYIGIRSNNGALYLDKITIVWDASSVSSKEDVPEDKLKWSSASAIVTKGAGDNVFPTLTNSLILPITYESTSTDVATISSNGTIELVNAGSTTIKAIFAGNDNYKAKTVSYNLTVNPAPIQPIVGGVVDVLNSTWTGLSTSTYSDVDLAAPTSTAHYKGNCAGDNNSIQLRSNNNNSGIVSTVSAGKVKRIEVVWNSNTASGRTVDVYGKETAYTAASDLYNTNLAGTKLGSIVNGTSTIVDITEDNYKYIGFRSNNGALYLDKVSITWLPTKSAVTIDEGITNGSVTISGATDLTSVAEGTELTLSNTPTNGYKLKAYDVYKTGESSTKVTITDSKFLMPEYAVTVSATFEPLKTLTSIEITTPATQTTFWKGEAFNYDGLVVTAHYQGAEDEVVTPTVTGSTATVGEQTVNVSYTEGVEKTTSYTITVRDIANTEGTAFTVAEARDIIDKLGTASAVYAKGIVSEIVTAYSSQHGNISYNISADGTTESDQLQAFRGKSYDGASFTSEDDIKVGDEVVVKGNLTKYNSTYEFEANNQLVSLKRTKSDADLAYETTSYEVNVGDEFTTPTLTNPHDLTVTYSSSDATVAEVNTASGAVTIHAMGSATITATFAGNESYLAGSASYTITVNNPNVKTVTFDATVDKGESPLSKSDITMTCSNGVLNNESEYRLYKNSTTTFECSVGNITKIEFTGVSGKPISGFGEPEVGTLVTTGNNGVWTGNAASVSFTASGEQVRATKIVIYYSQDNRAEASLSWNPESVTLTVGETFTPAELQNPNTIAANEITIASDNEDLAVVNNGVVSLVPDATGTATITATFAGNATYKPAEVSYTITVNSASTPSTGATYKKVTAATDITAGEYILVYEGDDDTFVWNGKDEASGRVIATLSNNSIAIPDGAVSLNIAAVDGGYSIQINGGDNDGKYVGQTADANGMQIGTTTLVNTISLGDGGDAVIVSGGAYLRYNATSGQDRFRYYKSSTYSNQKAIQLYKKESATPPTPDYGSYQRDELTVGNYGTICLPNAGTIANAKLFDLEYYDGANSLYLLEVNGNAMEAGRPYIFLPSATSIEVTYTDNAGVSAGSFNGLVGSYTQETITPDDGNYILYQNAYYLVNSPASVGANRAYIHMTDVPNTPASTPQGDAPRRRVAMNVNGRQVATGISDIKTNEQPVKVMIDGNLYIIRAGQMYDMTGSKVK